MSSAFPKRPTYFTSFAKDAENLTQTLKSLSAKLAETAVAAIYNVVHGITAQLYVIGAGIDKLGMHSVQSLPLSQTLKTRSQ
ncbi:hypothetical protein DL93DRAFT_2092332 [Clavulina sp. PMI_390]|nr:hypothetical protein DL93DRAFT_2092332 [Clavulina sp. PMI_390]